MGSGGTWRPGGAPHRLRPGFQRVRYPGSAGNFLTDSPRPFAVFVVDINLFRLLIRAAVKREVNSTRLTRLSDPDVRVVVRFPSAF